MKYTIYVLFLEQNKYYIGSTKNYKKRLQQHCGNHSPSFTKKYRPIKILELIHNVDKSLEKDKTLEYMRKFGWQNVRGYCWSSVNLQNPPKEL